MNVILHSTGGKDVDVLVARDAAQILDQPITMMNERLAILRAEDNMQEVQNVRGGHISTVAFAG